MCFDFSDEHFWHDIPSVICCDDTKCPLWCSDVSVMWCFDVKLPVLCTAYGLHCSMRCAALRCSVICLWCLHCSMSMCCIEMSVMLCFNERKSIQIGQPGIYMRNITSFKYASSGHKVMNLPFASILAMTKDMTMNNKKKYMLLTRFKFDDDVCGWQKWQWLTDNQIIDIFMMIRWYRIFWFLTRFQVLWYYSGMTMLFAADKKVVDE